MTAAATQRIVDRLQLLPDSTESVIMGFIDSIEPDDPTEATTRRNLADSFLNSFMNVEIDEQAIKDFRERSTI